MISDVSHLTAHLPDARRAASVVRHVLRERNLDPAMVSEFALTRTNGHVWLIALLDVQRSGIGPQERYSHAEVAHQISTALKGKPVFLSNHIGLHYAVLLSDPPGLPENVDYPGWRKGHVKLGVSLKGPVALSWPDAGNIIVGGMTRFGKTNLLRLITDQGIAEGFSILMIDPNAQFPSLAGHPALLTDMAVTPESAMTVMEKALMVIEERRALYAETRRDNLDVDSYNALAVGDPLRRVLIVVDEYNSIAAATGGPKGAVVKAATLLAWQGLKFGVHLVLAGHEFTREHLGPLRDHMLTRLCLRVERASISQMVVGRRGAEHIETKGRALSNFGQVQIYRIDQFSLPSAQSEALSGEPSLPHGLTQVEADMIATIVAENRGRMTHEFLDWKYNIKRRRADHLRDDWVRRGLAGQLPEEDNAVCIAPLYAHLGRRGDGGGAH